VCIVEKCQKCHGISIIIENVKYHITSLKHSYNTIISTESKSYQLLKYTVANSATPYRTISQQGSRSSLFKPSVWDKDP